jgi:hypothetical protein
MGKDWLMAKRKSKKNEEPTPPFEQEEDAYDADTPEDAQPDYEAEEVKE